MQIVGLTASIGIEKASTIDKAVASVVDIMANMDVNSITVVKKHRDELEMTVPKPDESMFGCVCMCVCVCVRMCACVCVFSTFSYSVIVITTLSKYLFSLTLM